jgi:hypothetical protein
MMIIGVDYHPNFQAIAFFVEETAECGEQELNYSDGQAEKFYRDLKQRGISARRARRPPKQPGCNDALESRRNPRTLRPGRRSKIRVLRTWIRQASPATRERPEFPSRESQTLTQQL